uniref:Uncharacterized protein n=1 Tax=Anopheles funestus TaxID=62324 RepID=A0A182RKH2_ANOFN
MHHQVATGTNYVTVSTQTLAYRLGSILQPWFYRWIDIRSPLNNSSNATPLTCTIGSTNWAQDLFNILNEAFIGAMNHYLAKFVILLNYDHEMERALMDIKYYFEHVLIMQYLVVIHYKEQGTVFEIGYLKENKFIRVNQTVDFESILKAQLKDLTLRAIVTETYLGQVTSFMIRLRYQENPQTLEQFFDSSILLNAPEIMKQFLNHLPTNLSTELMKKLRKDSPFNEWAGYEPGFAYIVTEYASDAMKNAFSYESMFNATYFYIMEEPLYEFGVCYLFGMWSKFIVKFKECLERLYETGIFIKLTSDAWRFANRALKANSSTVLMFPDLVPVFFFLCYGWALSGHHHQQQNE